MGCLSDFVTFLFSWLDFIFCILSCFGFRSASSHRVLGELPQRNRTNSLFEFQILTGNMVQNVLIIFKCLTQKVVSDHQFPRNFAHLHSLSLARPSKKIQITVTDSVSAVNFPLGCEKSSEHHRDRCSQDRTATFAQSQNLSLNCAGREMQRLRINDQVGFQLLPALWYAQQGRFLHVILAPCCYFHLISLLLLRYKTVDYLTGNYTISDTEGCCMSDYQYNTRRWLMKGMLDSPYPH